jgi:hypothetical protein
MHHSWKSHIIGRCVSVQRLAASISNQSTNQHFLFSLLNQVFNNFVSQMTVNEDVILKYELYVYEKKSSSSVCPRICLEVMQNTKKIFGITNLQTEFPKVGLLNTSRTWNITGSSELSYVWVEDTGDVHKYPQATVARRLARVQQPRAFVCVCVCACFCVINSMCHVIVTINSNVWCHHVTFQRNSATKPSAIRRSNAPLSRGYPV